MKKLLPGSLIVLCLITFCSCTKRVYNNQQVLQGFHNKDEVTKQFGAPTVKRKAGSLEEWTYDMNSAPAVVSAKKRDTIKASYIRVNPDSLKKNQFARYDKYIKFMFDTAGNVTGYKSNGVNLTRTQTDNFGIGLLKVLGITAAIILIVGVEIANNSTNIDL